MDGSADYANHADCNEADTNSYAIGNCRRRARQSDDRNRHGNCPGAGPSPVPDVNQLSFLTIPLGDILVFAILVSAAFYFRRQADVHKRLMLLATIGILPAAVARWPFAFIQQYGPLAFFGLSDLFIVPCLIYDLLTRGRPHRATVLGGALIVISHPLRLVIGSTHAWLAFATWLTHWT